MALVAWQSQTFNISHPYSVDILYKNKIYVEYS